NLLDIAGFWNDVQEAVAGFGGFPYAPPPDPNALPTDANSGTVDPNEGDPLPDTPAADAPGGPDDAGTPVADAPGSPAPPKEWRELLKDAAAKLLTAREVLYPVA